MSDVPTSGAIDPAAFPFLLIDLHRNGATGSLKVAGPSYQKALYFRAGRILFGSSNDPRDQLGAILIESGKITPEQLEDVNSKVGPGSPLAKILTDTGFVNQRELSEAARAKVERILSDVIAYDGGSFEFEDGVLPKGAVDLKLSTERVVVAAVRRVSDRNFVLRYIDGMEVVLRGTNDVAVPFAEIETDTSGITHYLDGVRTLKEAASLARLDDFEAAKIACALLFLGALERVSVVDLGAVAAEAQGVSMTPPPQAPPPPPPPPPEDEAPFMIPTSEPAPIFGMESGDVSPSASSAAEDAPFVLSEPEPTVLTPPEPPPPAVPMFAEPPVPPRVAPPAAPPLVPSPARRQYDVPPPEPPAPPPVPASSRPSQEDLAALDQLLNPRSEGPRTTLEKSVAAAAARPTSRSSSPRGGRRSSPSRAPLLIGILAVAAIAGAAGWFFFLRPATVSAPVAAGPLPTTTVPATVPAAAMPAPGPSLATPPPAVAPPTTRPAATPAAPEGDARSVLQAGSYPEAGRLFAAELKAAGRNATTVQLLIACSTETIQKAVENVGPSQLVIVPHQFQGRSCYRVCWGIYPTADRATAALRTLPTYFREHGASPRVMPASEIAP